MTFNEKIDYALLVLYKVTKDGGMVYIKEEFEYNSQVFTDVELERIKNIIRTNGYAVFQVSKRGIRGQITESGKKFVENDSFSKPGTSILSMEA